MRPTKPLNKTLAQGRGHTSQHTQSTTLEGRQAAAYRRLRVIQEALQTPRTTQPPAISTSSLISPTFASTPRPLRYSSQATQTSPSETQNTTYVIKSPTVVDVSSEDEYHGGALAATTDNDILDGSNAFDNESIHGGLTPAKCSRRVVIIDSDEENLSPPPPGQRPRPRTPSPSSSWENVPMPGAFTATQYEKDWNSPPVQQVEEIKADEDEDDDDFYV